MQHSASPLSLRAVSHPVITPLQIPPPRTINRNYGKRQIKTDKNDFRSRPFSPFLIRTVPRPTMG
ncbi:Uncharacterized protein HZ326_20851, partial [Fusarium oxysporum f. sp. albedinis]